MKSVAILTGPATHLDHLGILSALLEIPLIVTEEETYRQALAYYPQLDVQFQEMSTLSIDYLAREFDVIFESGKLWAVELKPFIELLHRKQIRFVFCPHGNSDKGYSLQHHVEQDMALVYGDHLYDHLKKTGALEKIGSTVYTGNYRFPFYRKHQTFYDQIAEEKIFSRFQKQKPTILYAPTWQDKENPTSFFRTTDSLVEQLSDHFNLIIKLHPFLIADHPGEVLRIVHRYENHSSILFLDDFPPIYPILARCDLYLGDFSSIGYDFLAFDKPLYFSAPGNSCLHRCGLEIPSTQAKRMKAFLEETLEEAKTAFSRLRQETYLYAFGMEKTPEELRRVVFENL
jgi:hypothetical protein